MSKQSEFIAGTCQQLLFSPKGRIKGALINTQGAVVQVTMPSDVGAVFALSSGPGRPLHILAVSDHSSKTVDAAHPVFRFKSFADQTGHAIAQPDGDQGGTTLNGVVAALNFSRYGQANGVILETGEFIRMRVRGMSLLGLEVGSKVSALGEARLTRLGAISIKPSRVNGIALV